MRYDFTKRKVHGIWLAGQHGSRLLHGQLQVLRYSLRSLFTDILHGHFVGEFFGGFTQKSKNLLGQ